MSYDEDEVDVGFTASDADDVDPLEGEIIDTDFLEEEDPDKDS